MEQTKNTKKMKNFVEEYDEEYDEEEDYENEDDIYQMKPSTGKVQIVQEVEKEEDFDTKVAKSIIKIHKKVRLNEVNRDFNDWVEENYYHLEKMYDFTNQKVSMEDFFSYLYDHSKC